MANFNAGNNMNITVHGDQNITEYTITIHNALKEALQPEFDAMQVPHPVQEELIGQSQELVEAFQEQKPSKFKRIIQTIREKGPEVADIVLAKCFEVAMKTAIGLL